jgi:hypothetical protein
MPENIFEAEWRECLEAHYMHVIRNRDKVTEPSLTVVMGQAGFDASELAALRVRATMHVDDSGADFVPDLDALAPAEEPRIIAVAVPDLPPQSEPTPIETEIPAGALIDGNLTQSQAEILTEELIEEIEDQAAEAEQMAEVPPPDIPEDDPDAPQQLSLF